MVTPLRNRASRIAWSLGAHARHASQLPGLSELAGRTLALIALALLAPALVLTRMWCRRDGAQLVRRRRAGLNGREFDEHGLELGPRAARGFLRVIGAARWPALFNVVCGEMALVGPRARGPEELPEDGPRRRQLLSVPPGLVCSWWIRRRRRIDYGTELEADLEYTRGHSLRGDLGLCARALAACAAAGRSVVAARCRILGVWTHNLSMDAALERIATMAGSARPGQVCFVNADCLNLACRDRAYRAVLRGAELVLADGAGVSLAGRISGQPVRQNVNGTDMFPRLCERLAHDRRRVFLLGARPGIAAKVGAYVQELYPGLVVAGARDGYFTAAEEPQLVAEIREAHADVLLVAFGAPRQELWIREHLEQLGVRVAIGVGGLFDFYSFTVARAPVWLRELGLEWSYRFLQEPGRLWKRYLIGNGVFVARVLLDATRLVHYGDDEALQS